MPGHVAAGCVYHPTPPAVEAALSVVPPCSWIAYAYYVHGVYVKEGNVRE